MPSAFQPLPSNASVLSTTTLFPDAWQPALAELRTALVKRQVHPADVVVLVPYAQLMRQARKSWAVPVPAVRCGFVPHFETTMNWAGSVSGKLGFFTPAADDLRMDIAFDTLTAISLLQRSGLASEQDLLARRLVDAAWSLARVAAAQPPDLRAEWGAQLAAQLSDTGPMAQAQAGHMLAREAVVARLALAWVAHSAYATDRLFNAQPGLFVVLEGFQTEPLSQALQLHFEAQSGHAVLSIKLVAPEAGATSYLPLLHEALDAEDEAERAAACVLQHLAAGRCPVALVSQDRSVTRRVGAMLAQRGVRMRDETGWKLSTTRAAAGVMGLLRAAGWNASSDAVLDWLKNAPAWPEATVTAVEAELRKAGLRRWPEALTSAATDSTPNPADLSPALELTRALAVPVNALRHSLSRARPVAAWLRDLRAALQLTGQWNALALDDAGQSVLTVLHLHEGADADFDFSPPMSLADITAWVDQALESSSFAPEHPLDEQVVILPLAQLLGRPMAAVVFPGCDEISLPMSPEPPGPWTPEQRQWLGLPSRKALADAAQQAWQHALQWQHIDILWRCSAGGESLMPSGFVQLLLLDHAPPVAADARISRVVPLNPTPHPQPIGQAVPVTRLSASAYDDLRRCPYRFFALRQLRLQTDDELDTALAKRDFGNWLHSTLSIFHARLKSLENESNHAQVNDFNALLAMINVASEQATLALGFSEAEFLPFAATWPRVRAAYLQWLAEHSATGARFQVSEIARELSLGRLHTAGTPADGAGLTLIGKLDRVDTVRPPGSPVDAPAHTLVIDYKTEPRNVTMERVSSGSEDTQLAFYAALMADDTLSAAYVSLGEKEPTKTYDQPNIVNLRDGLIESILSDMTRIADGAALPALGQGTVCDFCNARGLCRKDFWTV